MARCKTPQNAALRKSKDFHLGRLLDSRSSKSSKGDESSPAQALSVLNVHSLNGHRLKGISTIVGSRLRFRHCARHFHMLATGLQGRVFRHLTGDEMEAQRCEARVSRSGLGQRPDRLVPAPLLLHAACDLSQLSVTSRKQPFFVRDTCP